MGGTVLLAVGVSDRAACEAAAARVEAVWTSVRVSMGDGMVTLASDRHAGDGLAWIWRCSVLNERLVSAGAGRRGAVLDALLA